MLKIDEKWDKVVKKIREWIDMRVILLVGLFLAIPAIVNGFFVDPIVSIETGRDLGNQEWLSFWGSYIGAVMGCVPAFLALEHSRKQSKQQHMESEQMHREALEARRCSVIPVVDLTVSPIEAWPSEEDLKHYWFVFTADEGVANLMSVRKFDSTQYAKKPEMFYEFYVRNIGLGPALDASIFCDGVECFGGDVSLTLDVKMIILIDTSQMPQMTFSIKYKDVFSNLYERKHIMRWDNLGITVSETTPPVLIKPSEEFA